MKENNYNYKFLTFFGLTTYEEPFIKLSCTCYKNEIIL